MKIEWPPMEHKRSHVCTGSGTLSIHDDGSWIVTTGAVLGFGCATGREKSVDAAKLRTEAVYSAMCEPGGEPPPPPPANSPTVMNIVAALRTEICGRSAGQRVDETTFSVLERIESVRDAKLVMTALGWPEHCASWGRVLHPDDGKPSISKPTAYRYACKCGLEIEVLRASASQAGIDARSPSCPACWTNACVSYVGFRVLDADEDRHVNEPFPAASRAATHPKDCGCRACSGSF